MFRQGRLCFESDTQEVASELQPTGARVHVVKEKPGSRLRSPCAIAASLDILGDRWTLLVLRDILLAGKSRFGDLVAEEKIATSVLSERLQRLTDAGILARIRDTTDRRRWVYLPRSPAVELIPILVDLMSWGDSHSAGEAPMPVNGEGVDRESLIADLTDKARAIVVD